MGERKRRGNRKGAKEKIGERNEGTEIETHRKNIQKKIHRQKQRN